MSRRVGMALASAAVSLLGGGGPALAVGGGREASGGLGEPLQPLTEYNPKP